MCFSRYYLDLNIIFRSVLSCDHKPVFCNFQFWFLLQPLLTNLVFLWTIWTHLTGLHLCSVPQLSTWFPQKGCLCTCQNIHEDLPSSKCLCQQGWEKKRVIWTELWLYIIRMLSPWPPKCDWFGKEMWLKEANALFNMMCQLRWTIYFTKHYKYFGEDVSEWDLHSNRWYPVPYVLLHSTESLKIPTLWPPVK